MNREQLLACIWLRWRLTRNQFARGGKLNALISAALVVLIGIGALAFGAGGFALGFFVAGPGKPGALLGILDIVIFAFTVFWLSGLMIELQRSESVDLYKLLHLPVGVRDVFLLNYAASHFSPILLLFGPMLLGVCVGIVLRSSFGMLLLPVLAFAYVFALTAWTYCLRGWLSALMINKRRRRAIMVWITVGFVVIAQAPNLLLNTGLFKGTGRQQKSRAARNANFEEQVVRVHLFVPPGWVAYGAWNSRRGNPLPALAATAALVLFGTLGVNRAYRLTMRFYLGAEGSKAKPRPEVRSGKRKRGWLLVDANLPWVAEDTSALTLATFRSMMRSPEIKMAMIMPIVAVAAIAGASFAKGNRTPPAFLLEFASAAASVVACLSCANIMSNAFGLDRNGFRALVLLPIRRERLLLAKNLAFAPFVLGAGVIFLILLQVFLKQHLMAMASGVFQLLITYLIFCMLCNLGSILVPYRFSPGTLQAKKPRGLVFLAMLVGMIVMPIASIPAFLPPAIQHLWNYLGFPSWLPVNLGLSVLVCGIVCAVYWAVLPHQGRLLQRREMAILKEVTEELE